MLQVCGALANSWGFLFHEDAGLISHRSGQIANVGNDDGKGEESDDGSDREMVNVQNPSLTVSDVERVHEEEDEASEGSSELLERISRHQEGS